MAEKVAVIGLGYVGLPVALAFAKVFPDTVGFDTSKTKVSALNAGFDSTGELQEADLRDSSITFSSDPEALKGSTFFVIAVPTPIDAANKPDLSYLERASELVGRAMPKNALVVYESTVYPGVTEDVCGPILEKVSGLNRNEFKLGYSPERINPGDKEHTLERIVKVVSGEDENTLERVAAAYNAIIPAGVYRAASIKVAEAAKVIENTQRDVNISLMNELALIFDRLGLKTSEVLAAAGTKWNFLPFKPGLVGGHCIGVDPYYLTSKAEEVGYYPQVILSGRRINDGMGIYIAQKLIKLLAHKDIPIGKARVGILGLTFKENIPDLRNSRVPDIIEELRSFGVEPLVHDPLANSNEAAERYNISLSNLGSLRSLDALILAVEHRAYKNLRSELTALLKPHAIFFDVKSAVDPSILPDSVTYWSL